MQTITSRTINRLPRVVASVSTHPLVGSIAPSVRMVPSILTTIRTFASKGKGKEEDVPQDLASVLAREVQYEKKQGSAEGKLAEVKETLSEWEVNDTTGSARFSLSKKFGSQSIRLDLDCSPMPADDDEIPYDENEGGENEEQGPMDGYRLLITVQNPNTPNVLQIGAFIVDHLRIHRVTLLPSKEAPNPNKVFGGFDELPYYAGPNFDELDQALQNSVYEYLAARGIDDSLATNLADYCAAKEQNEYVNWLSSMNDFARAK